ncbi:MAG TPA: DUF1003 domain-containing protein [Caulobacteraceae bacterium]|nr:DUF1003 domain-containing protein [Caulobacteraceae bacterium]
MAVEARDRDRSVSGMATVLRRNIETMEAEQRRAAREASLQERVAQSITDFTGSMVFVYLHLLLFGAWIVVNLGWIPGAPRFDETFVALAMIASVEAIFLSTFVLISQNRMARAAQRRADLDLQINLLAEHEITRLITLTAEIAERLGLETERVPELAELEQDVDPETVMEALDQETEEADADEAQRP